jgi:hypothetical protein
MTIIIYQHQHLYYIKPIAIAITIIHSCAHCDHLFCYYYLFVRDGYSCCPLVGSNGGFSSNVQMSAISSTIASQPSLQVKATLIPTSNDDNSRSKIVDDNDESEKDIVMRSPQRASHARVLSANNNNSGTIRANINDIPSSILSFIFSFLYPVKELLSSCVRVSHQWSTTVLLPSSCPLWCEPVDRVVPSWFPNVSHIALPLFGSDSIQMIAIMVPNNKRLISLIVSNGITKQPDNSFLHTIISHPSLLKCVLTDIQVKSPFRWSDRENGIPLPLPFHVASQLQHLQLELEDESVEYALNLCDAKQLHTLILKGCWSFNDNHKSSGGSSSGNDSKTSTDMISNGLTSLRTVSYNLRKEKSYTGDQLQRKFAPEILRAQASFLTALSEWYGIIHITIKGVTIDSSDQLPNHVIRTWKYADLKYSWVSKCESEVCHVSYSFLFCLYLYRL